MTDFALSLGVDATRMKEGDVALDRIAAKAEKAESATAGATARMGKHFGTLSSVISGSATKIVAELGAMAAAYVSWQTIQAATANALEFNRAISETSTLIEGTPEQLDRISSSARKMAMAYGQDAAAEVKGFYEALSAGAGSIANAEAIVDTATKAAVGGVTQTATAVDILTSALNVYRKEGLTAAEASDALFIGVVAGKTTFEELASSMGRVLPMAQTLGMSLDETTAAVAALTAGGIQTSEAVTGVRAVLTSVLNPSLESTRLAKQLGIDFSEGALRAKGFGAFMTEVAQKTGGSATAIQTLFGSVEATTTALAFGGETGQLYGEVMDQMANKAGATEAAFRKMNESLAGRWDVAFSQVQDVLLSLGTAILPIAVGGFEALAGAARFVAETVEMVVTLCPMLGLAWQGVGVILSGIGTVLNGLANTMDWLTNQIFAPAVAWLGSMFVDLASSVGDFMLSLVPQPVIDFFQGIWDMGVKVVSKIADIVAAAQTLTKNVGATGTVFGLVKDVAVEALGRIGSGFVYVGQMGVAAGARFAAAFIERLNNVVGAFMDMTWAVADGLNALFKTDTFRGAAIGEVTLALNHLRSGYAASAEAAQAAADAAAAAFTAPMTSVQALNDALSTASDSAIGAGEAGTDAGDDIASGMGTAGKAAKATKDKVDELTKALNGAAEKVSSDLAGAFGDFLASGFTKFGDFTKGIRDSFHDLIADLGKAAVENPIKLMMGMVQDPKTQAWSLNPTSMLGKFSSGVSAFGGGLFSGFGSVASGFASGGLTGAGSAISTALAGVSGGGLAGLGSAIGALAGPVALVGLAFAALKSKTTVLDSGLKVTVDGMDSLVQTFEKTKRSSFFGLISNTSTSVKGANYATTTAVGAAIADVQTGVMDAAASLGIAASAFKGFSYSLSVSTKGMTQDQAIAAIGAEFGKMGDSMAKLVPGLLAFDKAGESASATLQRLATSAAAVNEMSDTLGLAFDAIGLRGAAMASDLVDRFGGVDAMASASATYYQAFYTDAERVTTLTRQTKEAFADLGLAMPKTRDGFRDLVEAQNLHTAAGRKTFAALLQLAGAMDQVLPAVSSMSAAVATLADTAGGQLTDLISQTGTALSAARQAADSWYQAADQLRDYIGDLRGASSDISSAAAARAYNEVRFQTALAGAMAGSKDAYASLTGIAGDLLSSTRSTARSGAEAALQQARVIADLTKAAGVADIYGAQQDATASLLQQQVDILTQVKDYLAGGGVLSAAKVDQLNSQLGALQGAIEDVQAVDIGTIAISADPSEAFKQWMGGTLTANVASPLSSIKAPMDALRAGLADLSAAVKAQTAADTAAAAKAKALTDAQAKLKALASDRTAAVAKTAAAVEKVNAFDKATGGWIGLDGKGAAPALNSDGSLRYQADGIYNASASDLAKWRATFWADGGLEDQMLAANRARQLIDQQLQTVRNQIIAMGGTPAFAGGGWHSGGVRIVGEKGPEIEATGPARYYSASQTRSILSGGDQGAVAAEIAALRQEVQRQGEKSRDVAERVLRNTDNWTRTGLLTRTS